MNVRENLGWAGDALKQRARHQENYVLDRRRRWWYTFKVVVCLLIGRETRRARWDVSEPEDVEVAYADFHRTFHPDFGDGAEFSYLAVGHGVRRGWHFVIGSTGYP